MILAPISPQKMKPRECSEMNDTFNRFLTDNLIKAYTAANKPIAKNTHKVFIVKYLVWIS